MSIESRVSGHWTDEQIVDHIYGVGPGDGHIDSCRVCSGRFLAFQERRLALDTVAPPVETLSSDFVAAQRRAIYAKISEPRSFFPLRRLASAAATVIVLAGGFMFYQERHARDEARAQVTDAQLAQEVSQMAFDGEPQSTAPLKALFVE
jgi:hypothetical protein